MVSIVDLAINQIGHKEDPPDSNKTIYGEWFGMNGVPWCAIFVSWVYAHANKPLGNIGFPKGMAGCQSAVKYFKDHGNIVPDPEPGDIVFFDWNGDGRYDHTGIFIKWQSDEHLTFDTVEGNTSVGNDSNGGKVMYRVRNVKNNPIFVRI